MITVKLILQSIFNIAIFCLFLFGIVSPITGIANIALFSAWILAITTLLIVIGDINSSWEIWDVLKNHPLWYKIVVTIFGTGSTLALVFNGYFFLGAVLIVGDILQLSKMWKPDVKL